MKTGPKSNAAQALDKFIQNDDSRFLGFGKPHTPSLEERVRHAWIEGMAFGIEITLERCEREIDNLGQQPEPYREPTREPYREPTRRDWESQSWEGTPFWTDLGTLAMWAVGITFVMLLVLASIWQHSHDIPIQ